MSLNKAELDAFFAPNSTPETKRDMLIHFRKAALISDEVRRALLILPMHQRVMLSEQDESEAASAEYYDGCDEKHRREQERANIATSSDPLDVNGDHAEEQELADDVLSVPWTRQWR